MKTYNIYGLSRSGNHAIIFWIINNLSNSFYQLNNGIYVSDDKKVCYINNVNIENKLQNFIFPTEQFEYVIKSYEDTYINNETSIIIVRDFLNMLCSRYAKYHNHKHNICLTNKYICDLHFLIDTWKNHTRSPKRIILYNTWLVSKQYRNNRFQELFNMPNTVDNISRISDIGQGSSFQNNTDYLTRYKHTNLPKHMIDTIINDKELLQLNQTLFSIDIENILIDNDIVKY